jgi:hypothetical protein
MSYSAIGKFIAIYVDSPVRQLCVRRIPFEAMASSASPPPA